MTSTLFLFIKGLIAGFCYSFISVSGAMYCTNYLLDKGMKRGMVAASGIILAQGIWAFFASVILFFIEKGTQLNSPTFSLIGAIILFVMAIKFYSSQMVMEDDEKFMQIGNWNTFLEIFKLALNYPIRIIGYAAIFAALGVIKYPISYWDFITSTIGVLFGTTIWWYGFMRIIEKAKKPLSPRNQQLLHRIAAFILIGLVVIGLLEIYL